MWGQSDSCMSFNNKFIRSVFLVLTQRQSTPSADNNEKNDSFHAKVLPSLEIPPQKQRVSRYFEFYSPNQYLAHVFRSPPHLTPACALQPHWPSLCASSDTATIKPTWHFSTSVMQLSIIWDEKLHTCLFKQKRPMLPCGCGEAKLRDSVR